MVQAWKTQKTWATIDCAWAGSPLQVPTTSASRQASLGFYADLEEGDEGSTSIMLIIPCLYATLHLHTADCFNHFFSFCALSRLLLPILFVSWSHVCLHIAVSRCSLELHEETVSATQRQSINFLPFLDCDPRSMQIA